MTLSRRQAREWAVLMLFAADQNPPTDVSAFIADCWEMIRSLDRADGVATDVPNALREFAEERVVGVLKSTKELDETLSGLLDKWDLYRLGTVERVVLRLGAWEMKNTGVPKPVVINEAIDLVNWFSSPKSRTLVNGVLDRLAKIGKSGGTA
jgi:N utilization substance protein B